MTFVSLCDFIDVGIVFRIISIFRSIAFLTKVVLRVTVVSAPAIDNKGMQVWYNDLIRVTGNEGADIQFDKVITFALSRAVWLEAEI